MEQSRQKQEFKPSLGLRAMFLCVYFLAGIFFSIPTTMLLVYPKMPSDYIISLFAASHLPRIFQFVIAALVEKYAWIHYGKKKTWIIIGMTMVSLLLLAGSFLTDQNHEIALAIIFIVMMVFVSVWALSLNAAALIELRIPKTTALIQGIGETGGLFTGGMILQKGTSSQFAKFIGLDHPITTAPVIFRIICTLMLLMVIFLHFRYKERSLESDKTVKAMPILKVLSYYKVFFQIKTKYCRIFFMLILCIQGFILFESYYEFQLINYHGFSRDTYNTISSATFVPSILASIFFTPYVKRFGWCQCFMAFMIIRWIVLLIVLVFFPTSVLAVVIIYFFLSTLDTIRMLLKLVLFAYLPVMGLTTMFISMLNCAVAFGSFDSFDILLTSAWGWHTSAVVGLAIQAFIIIIFPRYWKFLEKGTVELEGMVETQQNYKEKEQSSETQNGEQIKVQEQKRRPQNKKGEKGYATLNQELMINSVNSSSQQK